MKGSLFKDIEKPEADLWEAADHLRANPKLTSSNYFMPVMRITCLRHAANRFEAEAREIAADGMGKRRQSDANCISARRCRNLFVLFASSIAACGGTPSPAIKGQSEYPALSPSDLMSSRGATNPGRASG